MTDISEEEDDFSPSLIVKFSLSFPSIRVYDNRLHPCEWTLKSDVFYGPDTTDDAISLALMKIHFFFDEIVSKGIIWSADNVWAADTFTTEDGKNRMSNIPVITPYEPTDEHLAAVFQAKMNALAKGALAFETVELASNDSGGLSFLFIGDGTMVLPDMAEWVGEPNFFEDPWWSRDDASTMDVIPDDDADLTIRPSFAYSLDFLGESLKPAEIPHAKIIRPEFRPTIIRGGKPEENND